MYFEKEKNSLMVYTLSLYILSIPVAFINIGSIGSISKILAIIPMAIAILTNSNRIKVFQLELGIKGFFCFFVLSSISLGYSIAFDDTLSRVLSLFLNFLFVYLVGGFPFSEKDLKIIARIAVISSWVTIVTVFVFGYSGIDTFGRTIVNINGMDQDPNEMGFTMLIGVSFYFYAFLQGKKRLLNFVCMIALFVGIFMTGSRGTLLATVVVLAILLLGVVFQDKAISNVKKIGVIVSTIIVIVCLLYVYNNVISVTIQNRLTISAILEDQGSHRLSIWQRALERFSNSSFLRQMFGSGSATITSITNGSVAHNIYIETLVELGIIGLVSLVAMYSQFLLVAKRSGNKILSALFWGCCVIGLTLSTYRIKSVFLTMTLILIFSRNKMEKDGFFMHYYLN